MEKLSITLPENMVHTIKQQVKAGTYASTSEVLRAAMRAWMRDEEEHEARIASIKAKIKRSLDDPRDNISSEKAREQFNAIFASYQD